MFQIDWCFIYGYEKLSLFHSFVRLPIFDIFWSRSYYQRVLHYYYHHYYYYYCYYYYYYYYYCGFHGQQTPAVKIFAVVFLIWSGQKAWIFVDCDGGTNRCFGLSPKLKLFYINIRGLVPFVFFNRSSFGYLLPHGFWLFKVQRPMVSLATFGCY